MYKLNDNNGRPLAPPPIEQLLPALLDVGQVKQMTGLGERTIWRYSASGWMPEPVAIGRMKRWRRDDVIEWINQGCPRLR